MMILHELATNALKYGALSVPTGRLAVSWDRDSANLVHVRWNEAGGPKVTPPARKGFGTRLIERSAAHELRGEARLEYLAEGLRAKLIFPTE
jgi:two-component sensor histidine kinase